MKDSINSPLALPPAKLILILLVSCATAARGEELADKFKKLRKSLDQIQAEMEKLRMDSQKVQPKDAMKGTLAERLANLTLRQDELNKLRDSLLKELKPDRPGVKELMTESLALTSNWKEFTSKIQKFVMSSGETTKVVKAEKQPGEKEPTTKASTNVEKPDEQPSAEEIDIQLKDKFRDPELVVKPETCGNCHLDEFRSWQLSPHYLTFKKMHRKSKAKRIAKDMGIRRMKSAALCQKCHYTVMKQEDGSLKAAAGISCESCHGMAKNWLAIHNDYGKGSNKDTESPDHQKWRIEETTKKGMVWPEMLYDVAANCYGCHTVPEEELVNKGSHPAGSSEFELVSWLHGEIRHNFFVDNDKRIGHMISGDNKNAEATPGRKRLMYVIGRALDLEYSLRAVAKATEQGTYLKSMAQRVQNVTEFLKKIRATMAIPEVDAMLAAAGSVELKPNNPKMVKAAALKVQQAARKFMMKHDGSKLAAIDSLIPGPEKYHGSFSD